MGTRAAIPTSSIPTPDWYGQRARFLRTQLKTAARIKVLKSGPVSVRNVVSSFMRMSVGTRGMFVSEFAMFVSRSCVLLSFFDVACGDHLAHRAILSLGV
jgi:hypothetical protein